MPFTLKFGKDKAVFDAMSPKLDVGRPSIKPEAVIVFCRLTLIVVPKTHSLFNFSFDTRSLLSIQSSLVCFF